MVHEAQPVRVVTLDDLIGALVAEPLTNRECASLYARLALFRRELCERIQRRIAADPLEPIGGDQRLIRTLDRMIAALDPRPGSTGWVTAFFAADADPAGIDR